MDKLGLFSPIGNYQLRPGNSFDSKQTITTLSGIEYRNVKMWYNGEGMKADIDRRGLRVEFNPNKLASITPGTNNLTPDDLRNVVYAVNEEIDKAGLDVKLEDSFISRYDHAFDIEPKHPYFKYYPVLRSIVPFEGNHDKNDHVKESLYFGNDSKKCIIYDKQIEQNLPSPTIRFEFRALKAKTIKIFKNLTFKNFTDDFYYDLRSKDKARFSKKVFSIVPEVLSKTTLANFFYLLENCSSIPQINKLFTLKTLQECGLNDELRIDDMFRIPREHPSYKKYLKYRNDIKLSRQWDNIFVERYTELKSLFEKAS